MEPRREERKGRRKHAGVGREGLREGEGRKAPDPERSTGLGHGGLEDQRRRQTRPPGEPEADEKS
jgi:hypothetical protein